MKKNFIYLLLLCSLIAQAQVTPSYPTIKLTKTVEGVKQDSLLVIGTDKTVKHIPLSKISSVQEYATASALPVTGVAGKLYITKDNNKIYTWNGTFYSEFVGAKGEKGDQGIQGIQGVAGLTGLKGDKGDVGLTGSIGLTGAKGDKGDIGLTGVAGTNGLDGAKGDKGDQGPQGLIGLTGATGSQGIQGVKGDKGDQGIQGIQGLKGDTGAKGDTGSFNGDITADQVTETATRKFQTPMQSANNDATSSIQGQLNSKENAFSKNTAFNKNFGTTAGTVAEGNDSRINNGQTAFGWGNHSGKYPLYNGTGATGTWGINISGNATSATNWGGRTADLNAIQTDFDVVLTRGAADAVTRLTPLPQFKSWLGLGTNAYTSTAYLPTNGNSLTTSRLRNFGDQINANALTGGGAMWNYGQNGAPSNTPSGFTWGSVFQFNSRDTDDLALQFANNINHNVTTPTIDLYFRSKNNLAWQDDWKKLWHDGNFNPANYLPLSGGTINANNETINYKVSSNNGALYNSWYDFNNNRISFLGFGGGTQSNATFFVSSENGGSIALNTTGAGKVIVSSLSGAVDGNIVAASDGTLKRGVALGSNAYTSTAFAPLTSPALTGTPTAPTAALGTNTTQIATTAFVQSNSRPYKVYTALLSQSGTSAPVATVLENTLGGEVVWDRTGVGAYKATLAGVFTATKSFGQATLYTDINTVYSGNHTFQFNRNTTSIMELFHTRNGTNVDHFDASVEIRVYN